MEKFEIKVLTYNLPSQADQMVKNLQDHGESGFNIVSAVNAGTENVHKVIVFMTRTIIKKSEPFKVLGNK